MKVDGLRDRLTLRSADHQEAGLGIGQEFIDPLGPLAKSAQHAAEGLKELRQVLEYLHAGDAAQNGEHHRGSAAEDPHAQAGWAHEDLEGASLDELHQAAWRFEEVERVAAWRGVEHQQVVAGLRMELEQLLHRHVLLRAGEGGRELLVDPVPEDPVPALLVGGVAAHQLVEGGLRVEHHRPQLTAVGLDARRGEQVRIHSALLVTELG